MLWKNFYQKYHDLRPPVFGLNFVDNKKIVNKDFMLLCGFENFQSIFVRIDILERLFIMIFNSKNEDRSIDRETKLIPEMLNLLGCNKESFKKASKKKEAKRLNIYNLKKIKYFNVP